METDRGRLYADRRFVELASGKARNGWLYTMRVPVQPAVDAFDSSILLGFTQHAEAARRVGLEAQFRQDGITVFVFPNSLWGFLSARSDLARILRFHATDAWLPSPGPSTYTAWSGHQRQIIVPVCSPPIVCPPYAWTVGGAIEPLGTSFDGKSYLHVATQIALPPIGGFTILVP